MIRTRFSHFPLLLVTRIGPLFYDFSLLFSFVTSLSPELYSIPNGFMIYDFSFWWVLCRSCVAFGSLTRRSWATYKRTPGFDELLPRFFSLLFLYSPSPAFRRVLLFPVQRPPNDNPTSRFSPSCLQLMDSHVVLCIAYIKVHSFGISQPWRASRLVFCFIFYFNPPAVRTAAHLACLLFGILYRTSHAIDI